MPEGDTLHQAASRLHDALAGQEVVALEGSHRAVRAEQRRIAGTLVESVESVGKHLLVHFDNGWTLRTHLGMPGSWRVYRSDEPWRKSPGKARVVIRTPEAVAVCFSAPTVQLAPRDRVASRIEHLGPDLTADGFAASEALARARSAEAPTVADLVLDQKVMAGAGNVFKNEMLFLERLHPRTDPATLDDAALASLIARARTLLLANRRPGPRLTTGERRPGPDRWVHGRAGKPCRRCGARIAVATLGELPRITYWCPRCQRDSVGGPF